MRNLNFLFSLQSHDLEQKTANSLPAKEINDSTFSDIGCATWKLRQKMFDVETGEVKEEFRQLARHVDTIAEALAELDINIQDHTGKLFDSGQSIEVLAIQQTEGILAETVLETVRPTIYRGGRQILKGQVIIGTPVPTPEG